MNNLLIEKIRVFAIDDHQMFISGLQSMFSNNPFVQFVGGSTSGRQALKQLQSTPADVVLLDINLPDIDGIELNKKLQKAYPSMKVIALSMHHEASYIKSMIRNGAKGYVMKNSSKDNLQKAIRSVAAGHTWFGEEIKEALLQSVLPENSLFATCLIPKLSRREKEILQLITQEFTTNEIAEKLFISNNTVETHRKNLLQKLHVRNTAGLVRFALEKGLVD